MPQLFTQEFRLAYLLSRCILSPRRGCAALDRIADRGLLSCFGPAHGRTQTGCAARDV